MTIEYVDPTVSKVTEMPQKTPPTSKLLVGLDEKLVRLSNDLNENLQRMTQLNQRLFGGEAQENEAPNSHGHGQTQNQNGGLLTSLDSRVGELDRLVDKIAKEMDSFDQLA
ncbi:MAG: hypothetical protein AAFW97_13820 [Pseudomonadota bacterium]